MAEGENLTNSQEQDHAKPTSNAFGAPCMTITISEERIYLDRESLSDKFYPLSPPHSQAAEVVRPKSSLTLAGNVQSPPSLHSLPRFCIRITYLLLTVIAQYCPQIV